MAIALKVNHDALDDMTLVRLAQAGEGEAFRVIMQRGNQQLFRVARGIVGDDSEAEDIVQETYARAFAALGGFRGESGIMTWLTRITLNEARGRLRLRRPTIGLHQLEAAQGAGVVLQLAEPNSGDPEADAARAQVRELIERAVDELPEAFRIVFVLRDIQECTTEETAAILDVKPETVKTRLHRARRLLRHALDARFVAAMTSAFPFLGVRCRRITETALRRLALEGRLR